MKQTIASLKKELAAATQASEEKDVLTALDSSRAEVLRTMRDLPTEKQMADTITLGIVAYRRHWDLQFRETALAVIEWEDTHGHLVPR